MRDVRISYQRRNPPGVPGKEGHIVPYEGRVILTETDISEEQLRTAIEPTGYRVLEVSTEEYGKKGLFELRKGNKG